jgi:hypothetical protein
MQIHEHIGQAGLSGWRKTVADVVAPRVPVKDETARTLIGVTFFALSVYYVIATIVKATKRAG